MDQNNPNPMTYCLTYSFCTGCLGFFKNPRQPFRIPRKVLPALYSFVLIFHFVQSVDVASIDWHQVSLEYLEFSTIASDFFHHLKMPDSIHYPLTKINDTAKYRDVPAFSSYNQLNGD